MTVAAWLLRRYGRTLAWALDVLVVLLLIFQGTAAFPSPSPPATPSGLTVITSDAGSVSLSWTASSGATGYYIYRNSTGAGSTIDVNYVDVGLAASTTYSYQVAAYNSGGTSAPAAVVHGTTAASGGCPSATANAPGGPDPWGGCWPGTGNTGVPDGTSLTAVPGSAMSGTGWAWSSGDNAVIVSSCGAVLNDLNISGSVLVEQGNGTTSAATPCATITNSIIGGYMDDSDSCQVSRCGPVVMKHDEVDTTRLPGMQVTQANVLYDNFYEWYVNNHGGNGPDHCNGNCLVDDSWEHGLVVQLNFHMNAAGSNGTGAGNQLTAVHDYMSCAWDQAAILGNVEAGAGCTADLGMFPDFATITLTAEYNYLAPSQITGPYDTYQNSYCLYPGQGTDKPYPTVNDYIAYNVFARGPNSMCGIFGPVFGWGNGDVHEFGTDSGNVWGPGNQWDDGTPLNPPGSAAGSPSGGRNRRSR